MSEHKNTILAIVLSLVVIVGWQYFIGYPQMERQRQEAQLKQQSQPQGGATQSAGRRARRCRKGFTSICGSGRRRTAASQ